MLNELLRPEVQELIEKRLWNDLKELIEDWPAPELGDLLHEVPADQRVFLYRILPRDVAADVFAYLGPYDQEELLSSLADDETSHLINEMTPDDRTALLEELPVEVREPLLEMLPEGEKKLSLQLLGYPEDSVGRLMTTDYVAIRSEWTVAQALEQIRKDGTDSETVSMIYVVDAEGHLLDELRLRRLILTDPSTPISELMDRSVASLNASDPQEEAVRVFMKYDYFAMPVVDSAGKLLGIVTADDMLDVAEEEASEDIYKGAAMEPLDFSYSNSTILGLIQRRLPWLIILVFVSLVSSGVIAAFEEVLAEVIALAFFIPLLMGSGGNTGSQAATLVVRALAMNELKGGQIFRPMLKELGVGLLMGVAMGVVSGGLGFWRGGLQVGLVVGLTMFCIVIVTNMLGFVLPLILTRFKADPAVASSPLIASISDTVCLLIYFSVAALLLHSVGEHLEDHVGDPGAALEWLRGASECWFAVA